jgi:hypothetical protein
MYFVCIFSLSLYQQKRKDMNLRQAEIEEIRKKIRSNQARQKCQEFESSTPRSTCANCGKHYLEHSRNIFKLKL